MVNRGVIPNGHFRKDWQRRVTTRFDQPTKKKRRSLLRAKKQAKTAPRPVERLRPVVRCPGLRYNAKLRGGRGFALQEIRAAGLGKNFAPTVGISVDHRRRRAGVNLENVELLRSYLAKLVVLPRANARLLTKAERRLPTVLTAEKIRVGGKKSKMAARVPSEDEKQFSPRIARMRAKGEAFKLKRKVKVARGQIE